MSTQQDTPRRSDVVRCEFCGEDYSVTYRKCPFCDDMAYRPAPRATAGTGKGGKRKVAPRRGGAPMEPVRIIGYALGIILIIAAIYIVYTMLSPLFAGKDSPASSAPASSSVSTSVSASQPQPDVSVSTPDTSVPDPVVDDVVTPAVKTTAITLSTTDFTLKADETYKVTATLAPANSDEAVVWTSSDTSIATVAADGSITNVNTGSAQKVVTITVTSGSVSAQCTVRCKPGSTGTATPPVSATPTTPTTTPTTPSTTPVAAGTMVTINSDGVNIRETAGNGTPLDSSTKGAEVTVLETTTVGEHTWYKIRYNIGGGKTRDGYIRSDFVDVKSN